MLKMPTKFNMVHQIIPSHFIIFFDFDYILLYSSRLLWSYDVLYILSGGILLPAIAVSLFPHGYKSFIVSLTFWPWSDDVVCYWLVIKNSLIKNYLSYLDTHMAGFEFPVVIEAADSCLSPFQLFSLKVFSLFVRGKNIRETDLLSPLCCNSGISL